MLSVVLHSGGCSVQRLILSTNGASQIYRVCRNTSRYCWSFGLYCNGEDDYDDDDDGDNSYNDG